LSDGGKIYNDVRVQAKNWEVKRTKG